MKVYSGQKGLKLWKVRIPNELYQKLYDEAINIEKSVKGDKYPTVRLKNLINNSQTYNLSKYDIYGINDLVKKWSKQNEYSEYDEDNMYK